MYAQLGENNGGVILNISEGGVAVQAAMALIGDSVPALRFQLSANKWIQASAYVIWFTPSKRTVGLQFRELSDKARADIRDWLVAETGLPPSKAPADEEHVSKIGSTPQVVMESMTGGIALEERQKAISPTQQDVSLPDSKPTPSSAGLSSSRRRDRSSERKIARKSVPPEAERFGADRLVRFIAARLRRYLVDERHRIRLHDLVCRETENLCTHLREDNFPANAPVTVEEFLTRIHRYEELSDVLLSIISTGCFWGERKLEPIWAKMVERVATAAATDTGKPQWISLRFYPALLLLYAGGLAAIAKGNYSALAALLLQPRLKYEDGNYALVERLYASAVIEDEKFRTALCGATRSKAPTSMYLFTFFRERLREFIPSDIEYSGLFDRFEYLFALVWTDQNPNSTRVDWVPIDGPLGLFASKTMTGGGFSIIEQLDQELSDLGKSCPVLRSGLFGGSLGRLRSAIQRIAAQIQSNQNDLGVMRDMPRLRFSAL